MTLLTELVLLDHRVALIYLRRLTSRRTALVVLVTQRRTSFHVLGHRSESYLRIELSLLLLFANNSSRKNNTLRSGIADNSINILSLRTGAFYQPS